MWRLFVAPGACLVLLSQLKAEDSHWVDESFPFRIGLRLTVPKPGSYVVEYSPELITRKLNEVVNFPFSAELFDPAGMMFVDAVTGRRIDGEGFVGTLGEELVRNGGFEMVTESATAEGWLAPKGGIFRVVREGDGHCLRAGGADMNYYTQRGIRVRPHSFYRLSYRAKGGHSVAVGAFSLATRRWASLETSYRSSAPEPGVWRHYEVLVYTAGFEKIGIRIYRYTEMVDDVSFRPARLFYVLDVPRAGEQRWYLYYVPREGAFRATPRKWVESVPEKRLQPALIGSIERLEDDVAYRVFDSRNLSVWFAHNVRKVLRSAPPPGNKKDSIELFCARDESEGFQVVLRPKSKLKLRGVKWEGEAIGCQIWRLVSLPIRRPSPRTRSRFTGLVPDAMVEFQPIGLREGDENLVL